MFVARELQLTIAMVLYSLPWHSKFPAKYRNAPFVGCLQALLPHILSTGASFADVEKATGTRQDTRHGTHGPLRSQVLALLIAGHALTANTIWKVCKSPCIRVMKGITNQVSLLSHSPFLVRPVFNLKMGRAEGGARGKSQRADGIK